PRSMASRPYNANRTPAPVAAAYWTDVLYRPAPTPMHASLAWQRYAQAETTGTDATPTNDEEAPTARPMTAVPGNGTNAAKTGKVENDVPQQGGTVIETAPASLSVAPHVITI